MDGDQSICSCCGKEIPASGRLDICPECRSRLAGPLGEATMNLWEESLSPGMTSEDSIRSTSWTSQSETLPSPRSRSLGTLGVKSGETVDFEIRQKLGAGGMGVVYTAHQTSIDRDVALKMVKPEHAESKLASEALMSEAVVTGCLDHPNVVPVYDLGVDDKGRVFYAMKEVEGFSWSALISKKTLDENLDILVRVADTVAFAHSKGILHRDLKPQNIMLGSFGEIMVMDWGAACTLDGANVVGLLPSDTAYCGTPAYMAPEMAKADKNRLGEASDVYLLGAILYHILAGRPPRCEKDPLICLAAAARNKIDPFEDDGELLRIALKAMAAAPADRFQGAEEFQQAIREYRSHSESLLLLSRAKGSLGQAKEAGDYDLFNRAIYGFREALTLWTDNPDAQSLLGSATLGYAGCAMGRHDYELAQSLLDSDMPEHAGLLQEIGKAIRERDSRKNRVRRLLITARVLLATITLISIAGFFIIRAEQHETEMQRNIAGAAHRRSLINLISAHYGNQNYEAAVSAFWHLCDVYGIDDLSTETRTEVRIAAAMNPYRGWVAETNDILQRVQIGDYTVKRPASVSYENIGCDPATLQTSTSPVPERLKKLKPMVFGVSPDGKRYSLLTEAGMLISGSVDLGGFHLERRIEVRDYIACSILENGFTVLSEKSGTLHCYDMNTYAVRELSTPGRVVEVCCAQESGVFYGLIAVEGKLRVYDIPVSRTWDTPYRMVAYVDKTSSSRWKDYAYAYKEGRDAAIRTHLQNGKHVLILKSDLQPVYDSRQFPEEIKAASLGIDGAHLAMISDDKLYVMNLTDQLPNHALQPTPVHYVSKTGKAAWPFHSQESAATNLQQVMHAVSDGDTVLVDDGTYESREEILVHGKADLTIRSMNGSASCKLVGKGSGRLLRMYQCFGLSTVEGFSFQGEGGESVGGGLEIFGGDSASVIDCRFMGNRGAGAGGGLKITSREKADGHVLISNCILSNNTAFAAGGGMAVVVQSENGSIRVRGCTASGNQSRNQGGGIFLKTTGATGLVEVVNCRMSGNKATFTGGAGGGLMAACNSVSGNMLVSNCVFYSNRSGEASGGGVALNHQGKSGSIDVADCTMSNNTAKLIGGGLSTVGRHVYTHIHDCRMTDNKALTGGGVIAQTDDGFALIDRCEVLRNQAESYGGGVGGHRIYPQFQTNRIVSNCLIADNRCDYQGGGVRDRVLVNCTITGNEAGLGGGASFSILKNCMIEGNIAARHSEYYNSLVIPSSSNHLESAMIEAFTNRPNFFKLESLKYSTHDAPPGFRSSP